MTATVSASEVTQELRVPRAVAEWLVEQHEAVQDQRPPSPGCHDLEAWRRLMRLPEGWPHVKTQLAELSDGLEYDEYGVIVMPEKRDSAFRFHAARHTARRSS
jgi:hypothetical protein